MRSGARGGVRLHEAPPAGEARGAGRDVLLVYAPSSYPPLDYCYGAAMLTAVLEQAGHRVEVFDGYFDTPDALAARLAERRFDLVGISGLITTFRYQRDLIRRVRRVCPETVIVSGGGLATGVPRELLELIPELDASFIDEAEQSLPALLECLRGDWSSVKGIVWRDGTRLIDNGPPDEVLDLDTLPLPQLSSLGLPRYHRHPAAMRRPAERKGQVLTSRGCLGSCDFCHNSFLQRRHRRRSADHVLREIDVLVREHGVNTLQILDETFVTDPDAAQALLHELLRRHPGITWGAACRADPVTSDLLPLMARAGCRGVCFGFDSFSDATLQRMGKRTTAEDNVRAFQDSVKAGVLPIGNLIVGYDNETEADLDADLEHLRRLEAWGRSLSSASQRLLCATAVRGFRPIFFATPYPGTALHRRVSDRLPPLEELLLRLSGSDMDAFQVNVSRMPTEVLRARHRALESYLAGVTEAGSARPGTAPRG